MRKFHYRFPMLLDFPKAKLKAKQFFLRMVKERVAHSPILEGLQSTRQHEGKSSRLTREDLSETQIEFRSGSHEFTTTREEMRKWDVEALAAKFAGLADSLEESQTRALFDEIQRATDQSGNTIDSAGKGFQKEHFLEMQRRLYTDFNPATGDPKGAMMVIHPDMAPALKSAAEEWEKDEEFTRELNRIREEKREEWRVREASRKLVD